VFTDVFVSARQRTRRQALGWFLVFLLISLPVGLVVVTAGTANLVGASPEDYRDAIVRAARVAATLYVTLVGLSLMWRREKNVVNLSLMTAAVVLAPVVGTLGGLVPLAWLTTRPPSAQ